MADETISHSAASRIEKARRMGLANRTHGMRGSPEYGAWRAMRKRCNNPSDPVYARYGGRGIGICDAWNKSFVAFLTDMGRRPSDRHTLERVDNDAGYSPENCEWRTWECQNRNRRNTVMVVFNGREVPLAEVAEIACIGYSMLWKRLYLRGWSLERAVMTPARQCNRK